MKEGFMKAYYQVTQQQKPQKLAAVDEGAVAWLVRHTKKSEVEARQSVVDLRQSLRELGVPDFVKLELCF